MRNLLAPALLCTLAWSPAAHAGLSGRAAGAWFDVAGGLGVADLPFTPGVGWTVGVGAWVGKYDESFAIGRRFDIGARIRQDALFPAAGTALRTAAMVEMRRSIDLLVIGLRFGGLGGPLFDTDLTPGTTRFVGGTVRAQASIVYRFKPSWSALVRLEAGVDIADRKPEPSLALMVGIEFGAPVKPRNAK